MKEDTEPKGNSPEKDTEEHKTSFYDCFRFASGTDLLLLFGGLTLAFLVGSSKALFTLISTLAVGSFDIRYTRAQIEEKSVQIIWYFIIVAFCIFLGLFGSRTLLRINAQSQGYKFRRAYLRALLQHEIDFYENLNPMELSSQIENDCKTVVDALDLQLECVSSAVGTLICGLMVSFFRSWQFALMMFCVAPFTLLAMHLFNKTVIKSFTERSRAYSKAGAIAEEALTNIKTVAALGGEKTELKRYHDAVETTQKSLVKNGIFQGMAFGSIELIFMVSMAIIFYIGSFFLEDGRINPTTGEAYIVTDIFTPLNAIMQAFSQIPTLAGSFKAINNARVKARKILDVIDSAKIPESDKNQIVNFKGGIAFKDVSFAYSTGQNKLVLKNMNLLIKPNSKVAFVGESGSGKSTIVQLLQKFYEPQSGSIELDGHDLRTLDTSWLRKNMAYVGQEPVLFSMTIRENLLLAKEDATEDQLVQALLNANAYDFVMELDNKMDTLIGGGSSTHLSGGQKQRIAIARALLKDAKVLILDEATSALDRLSEQEIHETLEKIANEKTIIIIAHRLSTIQEADQIIVIDQGEVCEIGRHQELMEKRGKYYQLQVSQINYAYKPKVSSNISTQKDIDLNPEEGQSEVDNQQHYHLEESLPLIAGGSTRFKTERSEKSDKSEEEKGEDKKSLVFADFKRLWAIAKNEKKYYIFGALGSLGHSLVIPLDCWLTCLMLSVMLRYTEPDFRQNVNILVIVFFAAGILALIVFSLEFGLLSKASESLTQNLRREVFYKFLRMHIGWHDKPKNKPGILTTCLEVDTTNAGQITGTSLGTIIQILLSNIIVVIVALSIYWQLSLIGLLTVPIVLIVAIKMNYNEAGGEKKGANLLLRTEVLVSEAINNMKTLISLNAQENFLKEYTSVVSQYQNVKLRTKIINGLLEGGLFLFLYLSFAIMYYLATFKFFSEGINPQRIIFPVFGIGFTALYSTQLFYVIPDTGKAVHSIHRLFHYLDMHSKIDIEDKSKNYRGKIQGNIEFKNVKFKYPTRNAEVFRGLTFKLEAGKHIGLTGPSGCGKSTIIQLLLRLYDVDGGEILIEGVNIKDYDLTYLRRNIGIVSQEPVLFYGSIEYNLKYANEEISDTEMKKAAVKANAVRFIENQDETIEMNSPSSPSSKLEGYDRLVGAKGGKLSGGQKQRIAIARAILRKPKILLLDEATSALDTESESLVQSALTTISEGLTTISVAHRLSTLQDLDEILVLKEGIIIERGNYNQLIQRKGYFYQLKEGSLVK